MSFKNWLLYGNSLSGIIENSVCNSMMRILVDRVHCFILFAVGVLLSSAPALYSQKDITISVRDSVTKQKLQYATVRIKTEKEDIKKRTNNYGIVRCKIQEPCVTVSVSYIGYKAKTISCEKLRDTILVLLAKQDKFTDEVVVTGNFVPTLKKEALYSIKVIDREKIDAQQSNTVKDALQWENNLRISQDNILGSSISLQGISGQNVKFLVDGVPVIGRLNGNIDVSQLLLNDVEKIELIQGPMSVQYGTDALGGVINIITKSNGASSLKTNANLYYETVGTYNADIDVEKNFEDIGLRVSFGRYFFGGFNSEGIETLRSSQWKPREQYFTSWQAKSIVGAFNLRYDGRYFNELILNRGEPLLPYKERAFDETYRTIRFNNTLSSDIILDTSSQIAVTSNVSYYERRKNRFVKNLYTLENLQTSDASDQDTSIFNSWMIRAVYNTKFTNDQLMVGFDVNTDDNKGKKILNGFQSISDYAVFGSYTSTLFNLITVQPGVRIAYNTRYAAPVIPSLNAKVNLGNDIALRLSYAKGFRTPALRELGFYFVDVNHNIQGNTDLKAEKSDNYQVSFNSVHTIGGTLLRPTLTLFYNSISNLITLAQVNNSLYSYVNIGQYRSVGLNASFDYSFDKIRSSFAYGLTGRYNSLSEGYNVPQYYFSHEVQATIQYENLIPNISPVINVKYNGKVQNVTLGENNVLQTGYIEGYILTDVIIKHRIDSPAMDVSYGVKNIMNVQNINISSVSDGAHSNSSSQQPIAFGRVFSLDCSLRMDW